MTAPRRPPIICSTVTLLGRPLDEAFRLIAQSGFDGIEVMVTSDPDSREAGRLRELSEDHALPVMAIHAPFLLMSRRVWGTDPVGKVERALELARAVRSPVVVVHPPYRWQRGYRRWLEDPLPGASAETGVTVAVENMFPLVVKGRRVVRFHGGPLLDEAASAPTIALDTSHLAVSGIDPVDALYTVGDRLAHVHLSNNAGKGWDSHLPLDDGVLDLGRFLETLVSNGYAGAVSLELDLRNHQEDPRSLRRALEHNATLCRSRLSLPA